VNSIRVGSHEKGLQRQHKAQTNFRKKLTIPCSNLNDARLQGEEEAEMQMPLDYHL